MEVSAGLCASEDELARLVCHKFYFGNLVPVGMKLSVIVFPGILEVGDSLLFDDEFDGISI